MMAFRPGSAERKLLIARGRTIEVSARGVSFDNTDANCVDVGIEVQVSLLVPRTMGHPAPFFPALLEGSGRIARIENRVSGAEFRQCVFVLLDAPLRFDIRPRATVVTDLAVEAG
jgi:hypothetical protein